MSAAELLADLARLGIRLDACGDQLRFHPRSALQPDLLARLKTHKAEILAILRPHTATKSPTTLAPAYSLAKFDWSSGYCPGQPVIRKGVRHKRESCPSRQSWRHIWGDFYCLDCWPPTDPLAVVTD
jgi:hypothetical protein